MLLILLTLSFAGKHAEPGGILSNLCCFILLTVFNNVYCSKWHVSFKKINHVYMFSIEVNDLTTDLLCTFFLLLWRFVSYQKEKKETTCDLIITVECIWAVVWNKVSSQYPLKPLTRTNVLFITFSDTHAIWGQNILYSVLCVKTKKAEIFFIFLDMFIQWNLWNDFGSCVVYTVL